MQVRQDSDLSDLSGPDDEFQKYGCNSDAGEEEELGSPEQPDDADCDEEEQREEEEERLRHAAAHAVVASHYGGAVPSGGAGMTLAAAAATALAARRDFSAAAGGGGGGGFGASQLADGPESPLSPQQQRLQLLEAQVASLNARSLAGGIATAQSSSQQEAPSATLVAVAVAAQPERLVEEEEPEEAEEVRSETSSDLNEVLPAATTKGRASAVAGHSVTRGGKEDDVEECTVSGH